MTLFPKRKAYQEARDKANALLDAVNKRLADAQARLRQSDFGDWPSLDDEFEPIRHEHERKSDK